VSDADLLAYLLDALPAERRQHLEQSLRGNRHLLADLAKLRAALDEPPDERDRRRADNPARRISRHRAGTLEIRIAGKRLQFRNMVGPAIEGSFDDLLTSERRSDLAAALRALAHSAESIKAFGSPRRRRPSWDPKRAGILADRLEHARHELAAGIALIDEIRSQLARWREVGSGRAREAHRGEDSEDREAASIEERLLGLVQRLRAMAAHMADGLDDVEFSTAPRLPTRRDMPAISAAYARATHLDTDETWTDTIDVEAGPWALSLAGSARPAPELSITVRPASMRFSVVEPLITLVRGRQSFETVQMDSARLGNVPLLPGESVLLVQDDEVWEVQLSLRNGDSSFRSRWLSEE
jgi:hypothetical protein